MRTKSLLTAVCIFCSTYSFAEELFDVVVVGGGAAGLAAAVSAAENGSKVILLEKGLRVGGNAYFSGGYYNAVDPELQKKAGIQDSEELFVLMIFLNFLGFCYYVYLFISDFVN